MQMTEIHFNSLVVVSITHTLPVSTREGYQRFKTETNQSLPKSPKHITSLTGIHVNRQVFKEVQEYVIDATAPKNIKN